MVMETDTIVIPPVILHWSEWHVWSAIAAHARSTGGVAIPSTSGVYEARHRDSDSHERLYIGKASNLRMRVRQGLVKGLAPHGAGEIIRTTEDVNTLLLRWAETDRPAAVEEELHRRYQGRTGSLPKHTKHT
jgi:hypothetical protein